MRTVNALAAAAAVMLLAGCAGAGQPTAHELAVKIPGCQPQDAAGSTSAYAIAEVHCDTSWALIDLATFGSAADEMAWMKSQGGSAWCCVQGDRWAATVEPTGNGYVFPRVTKAIGGRIVTGP